MKELLSRISELAKNKFWGEITIKFKDGRPVLIETHKTEKI